jgi:hypothetical protein
MARVEKGVPPSGGGGGSFEIFEAVRMAFQETLYKGAHRAAIQFLNAG